jgi:signal peptidase I
VNPRDLPIWLPFLGDHSGPDRFVFHAPERGDVIVFHPPPPNDPSRDFIKRVIGVPGDTVDVRQGHVYVNGAELDEPYIRQPTLPINVRYSHNVLGPDQYFVLGDNRGNSSDSRQWGPVTADEIVGRTWLVYWPFSAVKVAPNHQEAVPASTPAAP